MHPLIHVLKRVGYRLGLNITYDNITRASIFRPKRTEKQFPKYFKSKHEWVIPSQQDTHDIYKGGDLYDIWTSIPEGDKWPHFFPIYEKHLQRFADKPIRLLEIGVYRGASLSMWRKYFKKAQAIVGIDVNPDCKKRQDESQSVYVEIGSQDDIEFLSQIVEKYGKFDVIIDDASHFSTHMIDSFNELFDKGLSDDGLYIAEDTHCCYWESHRNQKDSIMDYAYALVDLMHRHHFLLQRRPHYTPGDEPRALESNYIAGNLESVHFYDSVIVFEKNANKMPPICVHR